MGEYQIYSVNGPVVKVIGGRGLAMMDMVSVGDEGLIGEVVGVDLDYEILGTANSMLMVSASGTAVIVG